jgi:hypothetical protein
MSRSGRCRAVPRQRRHEDEQVRPRLPPDADQGCGDGDGHGPKPRSYKRTAEIRLRPDVAKTLVIAPFPYRPLKDPLPPRNGLQNYGAKPKVQNYAPALVFAP